MGFLIKKSVFLYISIGIFLCCVCFFAVNKFQYVANTISSTRFTYSAISLATPGGLLSKINTPIVPKIPPAVVKSIYVTGWSAGSKKYLDYLYGLIKTTQINSVVIDVKDSTGVVSYATGAAQAKKYKAYYPEISDVDALVKNLHDRGVYVIGRIAVFEDPTLAKNRPDLAIYNKLKTTDVSKPVLWQDNNGLSWTDPASEQVWDYNIEIARDALTHGFDEINFDYIRFPTDGTAASMGFPAWDLKIPKHVVIKTFFQKLRSALSNANISADMFGQTTTNTDDMGIGQIFEDALPFFDYVCPMVYPSHYIDGFLGYKNPADYPYQVISYAIKGAVDRKAVALTINKSPEKKLAKIRPWLQDFNLKSKYDTTKVSEEIKAVSDTTGTDFSGYMLWNPLNVYTKEAIFVPVPATVAPQ